MTREHPVVLNGSHTAAGQPAAFFKNTPPPASGMVVPSAGLIVLCSCQGSSPQACALMVTLRHTPNGPGVGEPGLCVLGGLHLVSMVMQRRHLGETTGKAKSGLARGTGAREVAYGRMRKLLRDNIPIFFKSHTSQPDMIFNKSTKYFRILVNWCVCSQTGFTAPRNAFLRMSHVLQRAHVEATF